MKDFYNYLYEQSQPAGRIDFSNIGDVDNPNILVRGYGSMTLKTLNSQVAKRLRNLADRLEKKGDTDYLAREMSDDGIVRLFVDAITAVEKEMKRNSVLKAVIGKHKTTNDYSGLMALVRSSVDGKALNHNFPSDDYLTKD